MRNLSLFFALLTVIASIMPTHAGTRYAGGDISLLPDYEAAGAKYKTEEGKIIPELLPWLHEEGMNAMRVRLFLDPEAYHGDDADPNACQTIEYITPLCQRIKRDGFALMLDFHYSDTWADPAKQYTPAAWANLTDEQLYDKIYEYTKETLLALKEAGVTPDFIQPGNEISYGMLWGPEGTPQSEQKKTFMGSSANWDRLGNLLKQAIKACREVCPDAKIVIHTERVDNITVQNNFYSKMASLGVEYDIIGLSYYPYFHGKISQLSKALTSLESCFPEKEIMIVETGYSYAWEVPGTNKDVDYPYSYTGQNDFAKDLVACLEEHPNVNGLFWWWMEYNAYATGLGNWYNAPLFDSRNGKATPALKTICSFASDDTAVDEICREEEDGDIYYNLFGLPIANPQKGEIYIRDHRLLILK